MSLLDDFIEVYEEYLNSLGDGRKSLKACISHLSSVLEKTAHITRASIVAKGIGFCYYFARMVGGLGVTSLTYREGLPGKGSDIHKVMALAATDYCHDWREGKLKGGVDNYVANAVEELKVAGLLDKHSDEDIEKIRSDAKKLLSHFALLLPTSGMSGNSIRCYPEMQLIDFKLKIWGVPDLIIEDADNKRALIIEWKTYTKTFEEDIIQAYIYAMLEAMRLGYTSLDQLEDAITSSPPKINAVIIRPNGPYTKTYDKSKMRNLLRAIIVMAYHMTLLVTNPEPYVGSRRGIERICTVNVSGRNYVSYRLGPKEIFGVKIRRGRPRGSHNRYPCNVCPFSDVKSPLAEAIGKGECKIYFGTLPGEEKTRLEKLIWKFRYNVFKQSERSMTLYKGLYSSINYGNIHEFLKTLQDFNIVIDEDGEIHLDDKGRDCFNLRVDFSETLKHTAKAIIGIYNIKHVADETERIVLAKSLNEVSIKRDDYVTLCVPREKKPVLVGLYEPHVSSITHTANIFARVSQVLMPGEEIGNVKCGDSEVCLIITPISPYLRFPFHVFKRYYKGTGIQKAVVSEVDADLTYIDLRTLHALQVRAEYAKIDDTQKQYLTKFILNALESTTPRKRETWTT
jgi:hypothetical protein